MFSRLHWLHAFHWYCNMNYRHLRMASPTACFYFSSFEVPLIIYDPLGDSEDFLPSIEACTCKLKSVPSNRLLLLMCSVEPMP